MADTFALPSGESLSFMPRTPVMRRGGPGALSMEQPWNPPSPPARWLAIWLGLLVLLCWRLSGFFSLNDAPGDARDAEARDNKGTHHEPFLDSAPIWIVGVMHCVEEVALVGKSSSRRDAEAKEITAGKHQSE